MSGSTLQPTTWRSALLVLDCYGEQALEYAFDRMQHDAEHSDTQGARAWCKVVCALLDLFRDTRRAEEQLH